MMTLFDLFIHLSFIVLATKGHSVAILLFIVIVGTNILKLQWHTSRAQRNTFKGLFDTIFALVPGVSPIASFARYFLKKGSHSLSEVLRQELQIQQQAERKYAKRRLSRATEIETSQDLLTQIESAPAPVVDARIHADQILQAIMINKLFEVPTIDSYRLINRLVASGTQTERHIIQKKVVELVDSVEIYQSGSISKEQLDTPDIMLDQLLRYVEIIRFQLLPKPVQAIYERKSVDLARRILGISHNDLDIAIICARAYMAAGLFDEARQTLDAYKDHTANVTVEQLMWFAEAAYLNGDVREVKNLFDTHSDAIDGISRFSSIRDFLESGVIDDAA